MHQLVDKQFDELWLFYHLHYNYIISLNCNSCCSVNVFIILLYFNFIELVFLTGFCATVALGPFRWVEVANQQHVIDIEWTGCD